MSWLTRIGLATAVGLASGAALISFIPAPAHTEPLGSQDFLVAAAKPIRELDQLFSADGTPVHHHQLAGTWTLVSIGWLGCPDVCPAALSSLSLALDRADDPNLRVWFVSVDPERDTPQRLITQVGWYDKRIIPIHGSGTDALVHQLGLAYSMSEVGQSIDHSTSVAIIDPSGNLAGYSLKASDPASVLRALTTAKERYQPAAKLHVRPAPPTATMLVAYGELHSPNASDAVVGVTAEEGVEASLHQIVYDEGMARMRPLHSRPTPVRLEPGGDHIMIQNPHPARRVVLRIQMDSGLDELALVELERRPTP